MSNSKSLSSGAGSDGENGSNMLSLHTGTHMPSASESLNFSFQPCQKYSEVQVEHRKQIGLYWNSETSQCIYLIKSSLVLLFPGAFGTQTSHAY